MIDTQVLTHAQAAIDVSQLDIKLDHLKLRPRHYSAYIMSLPDRNQRAEALEQCPAEWQALIKRHVVNEFQRGIKS